MVAEPINTPAATVDAVVAAETPLATAATAPMAAAAPPAVTTTATAAAATTAPAISQCHQSYPDGSCRTIGLLPQYA